MWRKVIRRARLYYETHFITFLLLRVKWLFWPIYKLLKMGRICFVVNIGGGTGHIICELDYFCRRKFLHKIDENRRYVWIRKSDEYSKTCVKLYGDYFYYAVSNDFIYDLLLPWMVGFSDTVLDCGLSRLKWQIPDDKKRLVKNSGQEGYLYQTSKGENYNQWAAYFQVRNDSANYFPLNKNLSCPENLKKFLGSNKKIALIHIKNSIINATASPTDPYTYLETLEFLKNGGYQIVFVGREKMPDIFLKYGVKNYAESSIKSFENDFYIFSLADVSIVAGSGISYFPEVLGKKYLFLNSWHIGMAVFSPFCIIVPCLVKKRSGEFLNFFEQIDLYSGLEDRGAEIFPGGMYTQETSKIGISAAPKPRRCAITPGAISPNIDPGMIDTTAGALAQAEMPIFEVSWVYQARNCSSDEILEAMKELISLGDKDELQKMLQKKRANRGLYHVESRFGAYFLHKHKELV